MYATIDMAGGALDGGYDVGLMMDAVGREDVVAEAAARDAFVAFCQTRRLDGSAVPRPGYIVAALTV